MKKLNPILALAFGVTLAAPLAASAAQPAKTVQARTTEVVVNQWGPLAEIVRERTNRKNAKFTVEQTRVDEGAVLEIKIVSRSDAGEVLRFRCLAVDTTSECFEKTRQFAFLPGDDSIVLTISAWPEHVEQVSEFKQRRQFFAKR